MQAISFFLTTPQFVARTKDVTRRLNWSELKPGALLEACVKCMGLKKGEKRQKLGVIRVLSAIREPLAAIADYPDDCRREGFPELTPAEFVAMFAKHQRCKPQTIVTRIEFETLLLERESARRLHLIRKKYDVPLPADEHAEFVALQELFGRYQDAVAPLPPVIAG